MTPAWSSRLWARLSLVGRVMFSASLALAVAGALLLFVSTAREADYARAQIEEHLVNEMQSVMLTLSDWVVLGDYANVEQELRQRVKRSDIRRVAFTSSRGRTLDTSDKATVSHAPAWFARWSGVPSPQASHALEVGGRNYGKLTIEMTATPALNRLWQALLAHLAILALALLMDFVGILLILKSGLRPLAALEAGAHVLAAGDLSARIPPQGSPELVHVIQAFNGMAEAVERAQADLAAQAGHLRVTLSSIGDGVLATDPEGRVSFMNPLAEALTGWNMAAARGQLLPEVFRIVNETSRNQVESPTERALRDGVVVGLANHTLLISRDGTERPIADSAAPIRHPDGRISGAVLVFRDQTDERRKLAGLTLAASVFERALNGIIITDSQQRIIEANPAFTGITGYSRQQAIGRTPQLLASGRQNAAFYAAMWSEINATGHWQGEIWNRHQDGRIFPEELAIVAVKDDEGKLTHYIGIFRDVSQIKESQARLEHLARHDPLTGLPNRLMLASQIQHAISHVRRSGKLLALLLLDFDQFKDVNDSFGHSMGDELLQQATARLSARLRNADAISRLGGDEFTVLLEDIAHPLDAAEVANDLIAAMSQPFMLSNGVEVTIGTSIGIALYPDHGRTEQELLQQADAALYQAKAQGRGRFKYFSEELTRDARARIALEARLRHAITHSELCVYYQPQVDIQSGRITGAEALVRWQHPQEGLIPPGQFIPLAEKTGLIDAIGAWVLRETCRQGKAWLDAGLAPLSLAVNVSPYQIRHTDVVALTARVLAETNFPAEWLELELTESSLMEQEGDPINMLQRIRDMGVRLAIDDFGTGYSSLARLKHFPLDVLKIDKCFIDGIPHDHDDVEIAATIIAMGHTLCFKVLAEGVETQEQLAFLTAQGCNLYQGYLKSRPVPAHEFMKLMEAVSATHVHTGASGNA